MARDSSRPEKLEYKAVVPAEEAARYFERLAAGMRQQVMVLESAETTVSLGVSSNVQIEIEVDADPARSSIEFEVSWRPDAGEVSAQPALRVVPGGIDRDVDEDDRPPQPRDERSGTSRGQLPFPEAPEPAQPEPGDLENTPPAELADLAAEDVRESEVEAAMDAGEDMPDVFAENAEVAYESRAERAQPDTFMTTAEGELRDQSHIAPDTAIVEPLVEGDLSEGEAGLGGAASTPAIADDDVDPASADLPADQDVVEREDAAPFSEATPDEWR